MATIGELLEQAVQDQPMFPATNAQGVLPAATAQINPVDRKKEAVAQASWGKKMNMGGGKTLRAPNDQGFYDIAAGRATGSGMDTAGEVERDLRTMNPSQLAGKYGMNYRDLLLGSANASRQYREDQSGTRDDFTTLTDNALGVGMGAVNTVGGIAALAGGAIHDPLGVSISQGLQSMNEGVQNLQSDTLNDRRRMVEARNRLDQRDSDALYETQKETDGNLLAGLKRIGRDTLNTVRNELGSPEMLVAGTSNAVGSFAAVAPVARVLGAIGNSALTTQGRASFELMKAIGQRTGTTNAATLASGSRVPLAIGLMEGGGAYQDTVNEVMDMGFEDLMIGSERFGELWDKGYSAEQAMQILASETGMRAAGIQAPVGVATGMLVSRFEGNPLASAGPRAAVGNLLREAVEEGTQGASGSLAQNYAIQSRADNSRDLTEGVGQGLGLGALYGLGAAGVAQTPSVARQVVSRTADAAMNVGDLIGQAANQAGEAFTGRIDRIKQAVKEDSPANDATLSQVAGEMAINAPQAAQTLQEGLAQAEGTPEEKEVGASFAADLLEVSQFDPIELEDDSVPDTIRRTAVGATNRIDLVQRMADAINNAPEDSQEAFDNGAFLYNSLVQFEDFMNRDPGALDSIPADHPAAALRAQYESLITNIGQSPKVRRALQKFDDLLSSPQGQQMIQPVTEESVDTPEGKQNIRNAIAVAAATPEKANLEVNQQILYHASQGRIQISDAQRAALESSVALLNAAKAYDAEVSRLGLKRKQDIVSAEIKTDTSRSGEGELSALQHSKRIVSARRAGNVNLARDYLADFGQFVQHMQNKVAAINEHFATGDSNSPAVSYMALTKAREWKPAKEGLRIKPGSEKSLEFAQGVALEAKTLADIHNSLADAFPELSIEHIEPIALNALLDGPIKDVAAEFRSGMRTVNTTATANQEATTEPVQEAPVETTIEETAPSVAPVTENEAVEESENPAPRQEEAATVEPVQETVTPASAQEMLEQNGMPAEEITETLASYQQRTDDRGEAMNLWWHPATKATVLVPEGQTSPLEGGQLVQTFTPTPQVEVQAVPDDAPAIQKLYPNLYRSDKIRNYFHEAFKVPSEPRTRIIGSDTPLEDVRAALADSASLTGFLGYSLARDYTADVASAYGQYFDQADAVRQTLQQSLEAFLKKGDNGKKLAEGVEANRWVNGKVLNLTEKVGDTFAYNPVLLDTAVLAGMQWLLTADQYGAKIDEAAAAQITGMQEGFVPEGTMRLLDEGMSPEEAVLSLAQKIESYWGVTPNRNAPSGYTDGIPIAMAAEMLLALQANSTLERKVYSIDQFGNIIDENNPARKVKDIIRYVPQQLTESERAVNPLLAFPNAIETAVLMEPEEITYIGDRTPPVAKTQLRNPYVQNTAEQQKALAAEQATPYYIDTPVIDLYNDIGMDGLQRLFAAGDLNGRKLNVNHQRTIDGQNRSVAAAFQHLMGLTQETENHATAASMSLGDVPIRYAYNFTRVNRMQMLGKYNPQASKLVREAVLPTWSTLDLTQPQDYNRFALGLAQALDVKVHVDLHPQAIAKVEARLEGGLAPVVERLQDWLDAPGAFMPEDIELIQESFKAAGVGLTPVALKAVLEYAKYRNTDDPSKFRTSLYVEADGVTNGPINSIKLLTTGGYTAEQLEHLGKGGLFLNGTQTMNQHRQTRDGKSDLYQTATDMLKKSMMGHRRKFDIYAMEQQEALLTLMDLLLPDLSFDGKDLVLQRGIAKNPLTITVYGSGARGIAGNFVSEITSAIYERLSSVAQSGNVYDMFGDTPAGREQFERYQNAINALTENRAVRDRDFSVSVEENPVKDTRTRKQQSPENFSFLPGELENLTDNVHLLFIAPMRQAITNTVGKAAMDSAKTLRMATQAQSIFMEHVYRQEVEKAVEQKKAKDPSYKEADFLSRNELDGIFAKLKSLSPLVQTPTQSWFIAGNQSTDINMTDGTDKRKPEKRDVAAAMNGQLRIPGFYYGPANAGVSGIPYMVIGAGDGQMMQTLSVMPGAPQNTLKIFDGMNMKLSTIEADSVKANQAVHTSWQGNPLRAVADSFNAFLAEVSVDVITDEMHTDLLSSLVGPFATKEDFPKDKLIPMLEYLGTKITEQAQQVEARNNALNQFSFNVDQMASVASPYQHQGPLGLAGSTYEQIADTLNEVYEAELAKITKQEARTTQLTPEIAKVGRAHKSGSRILSPTALQNLNKAVNLPDDHKQVFNEILKSLATKGYKVVYGTREQIAAYNAQTGIDPFNGEPIPQTVNGATVIGNQTIYLISPSSETLIHELVHASTFETILAHYSGQDLGTNGPVIKAAIRNLEILMNQFLNLGDQLGNSSLEARQAYEDASAAILNAMNNPEMTQADAKAHGLNEFMAWGLTNEHLIRLQKRNEANPLVRLGKKIIEAIKSLIWGRKKAPAPGKDMFSNLVFNSSIIMRAQPTVPAMVQDGMLYQQTATGNDLRLANVEKGFHNLVSRFMKEKLTSIQGTQVSQLRDASILSASIATSVQAHGFPMTVQEDNVFRMMVQTLATEAKVDPNALARAQELYAHVEKNLKVEDFMQDPNSQDPNERYAAQEKYNTVMGNYLTLMDVKDRSTLLPAFLALATVNEEFRSVLRGMKVPKRVLNQWDSLDNALENAGNIAMESLSKRLSGEKNAPNVQMALDNLTQQIVDLSMDKQSFLDQASNMASSKTDGLNQYVINGVERLAQYAADADNALAGTNASKLAQVTARWGRLVTALATEEKGQIAAQGLMSAANRAKLWEPLHTLLNDLIGRTMSNAQVYDMIKAVRAMIQQDRQQFRENLPTIIAEKFSRKLTDQEWSTLHAGLGKTDVAALLDGFTMNQVQDMLANQNTLDQAISTLETSIRRKEPSAWNTYQTKAEQLAVYMMQGNVSTNLLRNAHAIANLFGSSLKPKNPAAVEKDIDQLVSLYAYRMLSQQQKDAIASLVQREKNGMTFLTHYLVGQRVEEQRKATSSPMARANHFKGWMPTQNEEGASLLVLADNSPEAQKMREMGFIRLGDYSGSTLDRFQASRGYYYSPVSGRAMYNQGILQNVRQMAGGVDVASGHTLGGITAGRITDKTKVAAITRNLSRETGNEALMPVFDGQGQVVAYERSMDPNQLRRLNPDTHLAKVVGMWRGRQVEEAKAQIFNQKLVDALHAMYQNDVKEGKQNEYIDLNSASLDPVMKDALKLMTPETRDYVESVFGDEFWVRKDMLNDAFGYREPSVGDMWTGTSRWSPATQERVKDIAMGVFGREAYQKMVKAEQVVKNFVSDARVLIVVKSVVVPVSNLISNVYQMMARGVPLRNIARDMPRKVAEIQAYEKSRLRMVEAEAELRAATGNVRQERILKAEIQSIQDSHKRMSIWPLIEAGEYSSISDVGISRDEILLSEGRLNAYMENLVSKLPDSVRTAGRYALITKDTALFQGLQKAVEYGDFLAKALIYDDIVLRQKKDKAYALGRVTEEFVNYDRLPGRFRGYLENMGLLWFWNFKIRSAKIAVSMVRNNPVHTLFATLAPTPTMFGSVGMPTEDNIFAKLADGTLDNSMGIGQGLRAPMLNPWLNLTQ